MMQRTLVIACIAVAMAASGPAAFAKGGAHGAGPAASLGPTGLPGTASVPTGTTPSAGKANAILNGSIPGSSQKPGLPGHASQSGGYGRSSAMPAMTGVVWGLSGEIQHAGGMNDAPLTSKGSSLVGQSRVDGTTKGIGNSHVGAAQQGVGNSQGAIAQDLAAMKSAMPATPTNVLNHLSSLNNAAQGAGGVASPVTKTTPKACPSGHGPSTTCH